MKAFFRHRWLWLSGNLILLLLIGGGMMGFLSPRAALHPQPSSSLIQPCPLSVSKQFWTALLKLHPEEDVVERVQCAHLTGTRSLQALVLVRSTASLALLSAYVFNLTEKKTRLLFALTGLNSLVDGQASIEANGLLLFRTVDPQSVVNCGKPQSLYQLDLVMDYRFDRRTQSFALIRVQHQHQAAHGPC